MFVFLFTDLEASTRIWELYPERMGPALARHDALLRSSVVDNHGVIVKTTGDGLMATFEDVADCIAACVAAQLALNAADWGIDERLRVRMGVHVGEAEPRDGDYYGTAVNRAARIMAVAHGGQVLVSGLTVGLARPGDDVAFRDLGFHRLKDLTEPEHLFQLTHPDLPSEFDPLVTLDRTPNNLPVLVSAFVGRRPELALVREMLEAPEKRLVTLTGPGGTGKTRLALQAAAEAVDRFPDGVYFVDLSAERVPDAAFETVLRELGLSSAKEGSPLQVLQSQLRDKRMLLVLDNFEQVTEAGIGVAGLLQSCRDLNVVVTSREALRIRGEHVFAVGALSLAKPDDPPAAIAASEATELFVDRATAVRPEFALNADNAAAIAEITARLDGLPLAIELAAARLSVFTPTELRDRLSATVDVLGRGARDLPDRQQTLTKTIEWSYELLDPEECRIFEAMSVFATAALDAIEGVVVEVHGDIDVVDVVSSLVSKSLVRRIDAEGSTRFTLLQTIRDYASERLAARPEAMTAVRFSHARYFCRYAAEMSAVLSGPERERVLSDLTSEIGNLRTAWRWWVEHDDLDQLYVLLDTLWALNEARGWYHAAMELTSDLLAVLATTDPSPERDSEEMTLRTSLARSLMAVRGFGPEVEKEFKRALALSSQQVESSTSRAQVLRSLATYYLNIGDMASCAEMGRQLLDIGTRDQNAAVLVEGHVVFGTGTAFTGDMTAGIHELDLAIELFDPISHRSGRFRLGASPGVVARMASAILLWQTGWPDRADRRAGEGLELARHLDHPFTLAYALYHHAYLDIGRQRFDTGGQHASELTEVAEQNQYPVWRALSWVVRGVAECGAGRSEGGLELIEAGADHYRDLTTPPVFWAPLLALLGVGFALAGRSRQALDLVDEAIAAIGDNEMIYPDFRVLRGDMIRIVRPDDHLEATESYRSAIRGARMIGARMVDLAASTGLMEVTGDGVDDLRSVYATFEEGFDDPVLVRARSALRV
jgi:predicted ATPase/class 3 adenylate cyclase